MRSVLLLGALIVVSACSKTELAKPIEEHHMEPLQEAELAAESAKSAYYDLPQIKPLTKEQDKDGDKIPDADEPALGLSPTNSKDAAEDMDGDGYSNLVEYYFQTDVGDPESFPNKGLDEKAYWKDVMDHAGDPALYDQHFAY